MKLAKRIGSIALAAFGWFLAFFGIAAAFLAVSEAVSDESARVLPSYEKKDLTEVLGKEDWTEEDYDLLYHQTGVGRSALDAFKGRAEELLSFQEALFFEGEVKHRPAAFTTPHDYLDFYAPLVPLENGDVLVTSSCHTFGWRNGHAGLVVNGAFGSTLESTAPGINSCFGTSSWFANASNFLVLRLKDVSRTERERIALDAVETLYDIPYSLTVGIFSPKDQGTQPKATNCSHLVWQAFKNAGYDIDADGGPVCTSRDIALCDLFEVVQVYGFDPDRLW